MKHTLEVYHDNKLIFYNDGNWLHPLFAFDEFLKSVENERSELAVHDKIIGRAAALILLHLKITTVRAGIMSQLAKDILDEFNVQYEYSELVDRIQCRTESMLQHEHNPEKAFRILKGLAAKSKNRD